MSYKNRITYYDTLKVLAIFSIIALHIFELWWGKPVPTFWIFYGFTEFLNFGVPLFLMITGALLLNRKIKIKPFLKKKWIRIVYPFIFYLIIHLVMISFNINIFDYNWYFWMILCVYLSIPIINKFILNSSMDELEYLVLVIIISSLIYQLLNFYKIRNFFDLNFFMGPLCYLVLGYYFSIKEFNITNNKIVTISFLLFFISSILKMAGALHIIPFDLTMNFEANHTHIVWSWLDVGTLELVQASSIFILIKYIYRCDNGFWGYLKYVLERKIINKFIISVSKASYGMYLINKTIMSYISIVIISTILTWKQSIICLIILNLVVFFISWTFVLLINRITLLKKFSGYA